MTLRNFVSTAPDTALNGGIDGVVTAFAVASSSGYPATPFTAAIQPDTAQEELVEVTVVAGTNWTVTRGIDGTSAIPHSNGAVVRHVASARDFNEANAHVNATQNVHGIGAGNSVVGTGTAQTLTGKTYSGGTLAGTLAGTPTYSGAALFTGDPIFEDALAAGIALLARVQGDGTPRFAVNGDGKIEWGSGAAVRDANLYRAAADKLKTDDALDVAGALGVLAGGSLAGTLSGSPTFSGTPVFNGQPAFERAVGTSAALQVRTTGDANQRVVLQADGSVQWGDGTNARDTILYRSAADTLKTDDSLIVVGDLTPSGNVGGGLTTLKKIKNSAETVNNSTTLQDDNDLFFTVEANTKYRVDLFLDIESSTVADFKLEFDTPSGVSRLKCLSPAGTSFNANENVSDPVSTTGGTGGSSDRLTGTGYISIGVTGGVYKLRWAQNTAEASNTIVKTGSWVTLEKMI